MIDPNILYLTLNYNYIQERVELFERALLYVPSMKIWEAYLEETIERFEKKCILSTRFSKANEVFERAINSMSELNKTHVS